MTSHLSSPLRATLQRLCLAVLLASCLTVAQGQARADASHPRLTLTCAACQPCLGWNWSKLFSPIERMLGNQTRMIQFGVVALSSAMYIIWWRK
jgi:hypothetical protein